MFLCKFHRKPTLGVGCELLRWNPQKLLSRFLSSETAIRAQTYTCSFFSGELFFEMLAGTVAAFHFRGINYYSIQFEQVKCTLSGSHAVTAFNFWGSTLAIGRNRYMTKIPGNYKMYRFMPGWSFPGIRAV